MDNKHPFDQWEEEQKLSMTEYKKQVLQDSSLVFQVFSTDAGHQLLNRWKDQLINSPTAAKGDDLLSIGMNEGMKAFIRVILNAIKLHEEQQ